MTKPINEAAISLDIVDFNSSDFETLAQILHLAGVAENDPAGAEGVPAFSDEPVQSTEPELGLEPEVGITDPVIGDEPEQSDDITLGVDGQPVLDIADTDEDPELGGFDMDRMRQLSGIQESVEDDAECSDEDEKEDDKIDESFLPDLTLGEDATEQRDVEYGPFRTERDAVQNGQEKTNGVEGDNFIVVAKGGRYFWKRTIQEDVIMRPEGEDVDTDGIVYSKHDYERVPGTARGDNGLENPVNEDADSSEEEDESVEQLHESLKDRYQKYLGE